MIKMYRPQIRFSSWFPKLDKMEVGRVFHTIRFIDKIDWYTELESRRASVDIFVTTVDHTIAECEIIGVAVLQIEQLDAKMIEADTYAHWDYWQMYKLLHKFYSKKKQWKGEQSEIIIIFLLPTKIY